MFIQSDAKLRHQLFTVATGKVIKEEDVTRIISPNKIDDNSKLKIQTRVNPNNVIKNTNFINVEVSKETIDFDQNQNKEICLHSGDDIDIAGYVDVDTSYDENTFEIISNEVLNELDENMEIDLNSNVEVRSEVIQKSGVTNKDSLVCKICGKGFQTAQSRRIHEYVHNQGQYECKLCSRILRTAGFLRVHMQNTHNIFMPKNGTSGSLEPNNETDCLCDICKMYFTEDRIARHMKSHSKPSRPKCSLCPLTFSCTKNVQRHFKKQHNGINTDKTPQFVCSTCQEAFHRAVELYEHSKVHDDDCNETEDGFNLICDICPTVCDTYESYARHMIDNHNQVRVQPYKCRICSIRNGSKTGLYMHINCHYNTNNASILPSIGERNRDNSKLPTLVQKTEKPYSCSFCHFKFKTARRLEEHTRVHTGDFSTSKNLYFN